MSDPKLCSMESCGKPLGPDALEFAHKGEPAGGVCENCLNQTTKIRILFEQDENGIFLPIELVQLDNTLS
jgi:hypothetical protein